MFYSRYFSLHWYEWYYFGISIRIYEYLVVLLVSFFNSLKKKSTSKLKKTIVNSFFLMSPLAQLALAYVTKYRFLYRNLYLVTVVSTQSWTSLSTAVRGLHCLLSLWLTRSELYRVCVCRYHGNCVYRTHVLQLFLIIYYV